MAIRPASPAPRRFALVVDYGGCHRSRALSSLVGHRPQTLMDTSFRGQKRVEQLWREFFLDPSKWWDHRSAKANPKYPDFKHKQTSVALWIDGRSNPLWVQSQLAVLPPGSVQQSPFPWNVRLAKYVKSEQEQQALQLFRQMQAQGVQPDTFTFVTVTNACASLAALDIGICIHAQIIQSGCESDVCVANCLVDMYAKCGNIDEAQRIFNNMPVRDVVSWTTMINEYVKCGQSEKALKLYQDMEEQGMKPNAVTFAAVLNACASPGALEKGTLVHAQVIQSGYQFDLRVGNGLVDMYAKCGSIDDAWRVFTSMVTRDVFSWTSILAAHVNCEQGQKALELYGQMQSEGVKPNALTFVMVLKACASVESLEKGRCAHLQVIQTGCEGDLRVGNCLVDMYAKCGSIGEAWKVFTDMPTRNVVSWTSMLLGYKNCDQGDKALLLYKLMQAEGVRPDAVTFSTVLNACASSSALDEGRLVHASVIQNGYQSDVFVASSLLDMYVKCGSIDEAWGVFNRMSRNVVSWTIMLTAYVKDQQCHRALELYQKMAEEGIKPNAATFATVLNACVNIAALKDGRCIHAHIIKNGWESDLRVGNCLVNMYAKCGSIEDAWRVFNEMPTRDVVTWTAMIVGYVKSGQVKEGLEIYHKMSVEGVKPNVVTFVAVLNACAISAALEEGKQAHAQILHSGWECDLRVGNVLIDMYAKCGSMSEAESVFNKMASRDVITWTAMLVGYVNCEQAQKALELYRQMEKEQVKANTITFATVLNACASSAALEEGRRVHSQVVQSGCDSDALVASNLVDMYAKCGSIDDAYRVFNKMPVRDVVCWTAMLGGLAMHGHGKEALKFFDEMCDEGVQLNSTTFVCLLTACSHAGLVDEGLHHFESMGPAYGILPEAEHYVAVVDILGRAGRLHEAEEIMNAMLSDQNTNWQEYIVIAMKSIVSACGKHGNLDIGKRVAGQLLKLDPDDSSGYVLLSNIYATAGC